MFQKIITRLLKRRHFWRHIGFAELAELYTSRMMHLLALNMVTVMIAIFLYQNGYSVAFIAGYFAVYFVVRGFCVVPSAYIISWIGPKHATLWANLLYIPALILLWFVPQAGISALILALLFKAASTSLHDVAYMVDFSKVKHVDHAGKELGYMQIFERIATAASPLIGGFIAFLFGPQVTIVAAALLFAVAAMPLFFTAEPIPTRQKLSFKGFRVRHLWQNLVAEGAVGFSNEGAHGSTWSLFIVVCILGMIGNAVYAEIGMLSAVSIIASIAIAYIFGLLIDHRRGGDLLKLSIIGASILHVVRPFLPNAISVAVMNAASQVATTGYSMPFIRGMFDEADMKPGFRILYLSAMSLALCIGAALANFTLMGLALLLGEKQGLQAIFFVMAIVSLLIVFNGFRLYRKG